LKVKEEEGEAEKVMSSRRDRVRLSRWERRKEAEDERGAVQGNRKGNEPLIFSRETGPTRKKSGF
jgi:hypothetical protein